MTVASETQLAILFDRFVRRIHTDLRRAAPEFDTEAIGPGGAMILLALDDIGAVAMQSLAREMVKDKSQLTREIASLERKGLVARKVAPDDGRVSIVALTPRGTEVVAKTRKAIGRAIGAALDPLSESERVSLTALLQKVA